MKHCVHVCVFAVQSVSLQDVQGLRILQNLGHRRWWSTWSGPDRLNPSSSSSSSSILSSPPVQQLRHPVAPEKAEQEKGGVALQQHISCKFMQNSKSAAAAGSAAAAAVLHTARTRTAPAGCTGPTSPRTRFAAGSRLQEEAERPGPVTVSTDRDPPPLSSGERARQQQRLAGC